jgi:transposase-like protein
MRVHRNAKTTPKMRRLIVTRAQQGWTYAQIAEAIGISVRTVAKWVRRAQHPAGLWDGSSRPHRQPSRTRAPGARDRDAAAPPADGVADFELSAPRRAFPSERWSCGSMDDGSNRLLGMRHCASTDEGREKTCSGRRGCSFSS